MSWLLNRRTQVAVDEYRIGPEYDGEGAAKFIFERVFTDPVYSFRGRGRLAGSLMVTQHPQTYYSLAVPTRGIGGLTAGQIFGQPLVSQEPVQP